MEAPIGLEHAMSAKYVAVTDIDPSRAMPVEVHV